MISIDRIPAQPVVGPNVGEGEGNKLGDAEGITGSFVGPREGEEEGT